MNTVTIGKVTVNYINCDTESRMNALEEDLLKIVRDSAVIEYPRIIEDRAQYEYLYHLSDIRGNIVRWLPIKAGDAVLELDAECGAITGALLEKSENVTATVNCATQAEILAERYSNCKRFCIFAGDFKNIITEVPHKFDWIITRDPLTLRRLTCLLNPFGRIVFITDNRMGMRNLAGVKAYGEDEYFTGIEGKGNAGFTYSGLRKLIAWSGTNQAQIYYPYPDWRFLKNLYSNARLPKTGELTDNLMNFNSDRLELFSEKEAFDASCEDGSFPYYSNSYLVIIGEPLSIEYARFSNDRAPEYAIYTSIENHEGSKIVKKYPISGAANNHIRNLSKYYKLLDERYAGSKLRINRCNLLDLSETVSASFEYVKGTELSKILDECLAKEDYESFYSYFDKYVALVGYHDDAKIADIDVVFSNILVDGDDWTLIDYEWCKEGSIPIKETAYRAIYCYLLEDERRRKINQDLILKKLVLSKEASEDIEADEVIFQKHVTGRNLSLQEIRERIGYVSYNPIMGETPVQKNDSIYKFRIYPGGINAEFSEDTAFDIADAYKSENMAEALIPVMKEDKVIRIDPVDSPCIVTIREAMLGEAEFPVDNKKYLIVNGKRLGADSFIFSTDDPNMYFDLDGFVHDEDTFLFVRLEVVPLSKDTAVSVEKSVKKLF